MQPQPRPILQKPSKPVPKRQRSGAQEGFRRLALLLAALAALALVGYVLIVIWRLPVGDEWIWLTISTAVVYGVVWAVVRVIGWVVAGFWSSR